MVFVPTLEITNPTQTDMSHVCSATSYQTLISHHCITVPVITPSVVHSRLRNNISSTIPFF